MLLYNELFSRLFNKQDKTGNVIISFYLKTYLVTIYVFICRWQFCYCLIKFINFQTLFVSIIRRFSCNKINYLLKEHKYVKRYILIRKTYNSLCKLAVSSGRVQLIHKVAKLFNMLRIDYFLVWITLRQCNFFYE